MERWVAKIIVLVLIFIVPFICTMLPYKMSGYFARKGEKGKKVLSCLMCFGGGVFFATFILHMGPEVRSILDHSFLKPNNITYPVPDLVMGVGFFLVFFIEKMVLKWNKKRQQRKAEFKRQQCLQINKLSSCENGDSVVQNGKIRNNLTGGTSSTACTCHPRSGSAHLVVDIEDMGTPKHKEVPGDNCPLRGTGDCCNDPAELKIRDAEDAEMLAGKENSFEHADDEEIKNAHNTRSLVLILALSMHRIFEGMSVGLQQSGHTVWSLFVAVMCHETVIGFGLGLQFIKNKFSLKKMLITVFLCSMIMPIGVAIGTAMIETGESSPQLDTINGMLQALATGTFIYVTFFEILQEEIDPHDTCMSKFFSVLIGFVVMALLSLVPEQDDSLLKPTQDLMNATTMSVLANSP